MLDHRITAFFYRNSAVEYLFVEKEQMENMNVGILIGTLAFLIAIIALVAAVFLRFSARSSPSQLLRYFFYAGIPIMFLTSGAGLWECYKSGDWTKCLVPIGILCLAISALMVSSRLVSRANNDSSEDDKS